ncbi:MAG: pitrilysin family protein [Pseudomonadota bacterium]
MKCNAGFALAAVVASFVTGCANVTPTAAPKDDNAVFATPYLMEELDNGLRVIIVKTDFPDIVTLQIPVQTGSRNEVEAGKSGFAHFFEHMMFRGTERFPAQAYGEILQNAGADQNAYTTDDYTNYHVTFTKPDLETVLELEADRFMNLKYSETDFRTEALAVKGEYLKNYANPVQKLIERLREVAFDTHTYQHTTMGFLRDIEDMPNQKAYADVFFDRWYRPEKAAVIIVGDVDPDATLALVKQYWGSWERGDYTVDVPVEPAPSGPRIDHIEWESKTQPWYTVSFRGPAFSDARKDMAAMDVLSSMHFSESSPLYQSIVVEDQLADQLFTWFPDRKDPYLLLVAARLTDPANAAEVRDRIDATLARARTELAPATLVDATTSRLRYAFTSSLDNSASIGDTLAAYVHFDRTPETLNGVFAQYDALTPEDLRRYANQYFVDEGRVTITLSNDPTLPGIDGSGSVDAAITRLAGATGVTVNAPESTAAIVARATRASTTPPAAGAVNLNIVAQPSATSALVDVSFVFGVGAADDPQGKKGLAALTAAMLSQGGSQALPIADIEAAMYPMAAGFAAQTDKEMTRLSGTVHRDNLGDWYALISGQLFTPGWRQSDLERLKTQQINAIRTGLVGNNDEELGKELLYQAIYTDGHPYGSLNLGDVSDIESITVQDVQAFYAQHYTQAAVTLGLAGGFDSAFREQVERDLANLPAGTNTVIAVANVVRSDRRSALVVQKQTPAVAVSFGFPIDVQRGDRDWVALWLARSWLGEHRSSNAHLYQRIRETRGMNYGDYAYIEYFPRGMFQFYPDANLARQQQIFQVWIRPLRTNNDALFATRTAVRELELLIANGLSEADFESSRNYLSKFVSLLTKTQGRQLGYAIDSQYYGTPAFADYVREALAELTVDDVNRAIQRHLSIDGLQFVFISGDADALAAAIASDEPSPITYNSDKPQALLDEDAIIATMPLAIDRASIVRRSASELFE